MDIEAKVGVKEATLSAVVIRADGTREDLGVIASSRPGRLRRWWRKIRHGAHG
jgi:transposase-like protein